jgi:ribonuclease HII
VKATALAWTIQHAEPRDIDERGMAAALRATFKKAIDEIDRQLPGINTVLIDGNPLGIDSREKTVVKGDAKCASIAAASIIAKVERDAIMVEYASQYPEYGFESCKGYGSQKHMAAIEAHGLTPIHRRSFCGFYQQQSLF